MTVRILEGDCRDVLKTLPDESVHCCVTSPPYFGLRDYGVDGQMGLESTPDEFVAGMVEVFREVRRVLRDDGTLWLNIGDSYCSTDKWGGGKGGNTGKQTVSDDGSVPSWACRTKRPKIEGVKPKDLIGIPWMLAFALREPYYIGKMKTELDRVWMAAMVDAEGSICGSEYESGDRTKTNIYISVTNTARPIIEKCERLFPQDVRHVYEKTGRTDRVCYRWDVERIEQKALFLREIYPYLVAKKKQAILGYTFVEMQRGLASKKKGYFEDQHEKRSWLIASLSALNRGVDVDLPDWVIEPPSPTEPGFYLRQDIIWAKPNPMPESVRDRCTKAHEYLFLLSKSERYYFDTDAVKEAAVTADEYVYAGDGNGLHSGESHAGSGNSTRRYAKGVAGWAECEGGHNAIDHNQAGRDSHAKRVKNNGVGFGHGYDKKPKPRVVGSTRNSFARETKASTGEHGQKPQHRADRDPIDYSVRRNKRSVWSIPTAPFKEAHFATFPPALVEPCILAGCPEGGTVLDPFGGAGTTGLVADRLQRDAVLIELNPEYSGIARRRIHSDAPLFAEVCA